MSTYLSNQPAGFLISGYLFVKSGCWFLMLTKKLKQTTWKALTKDTSKGPVKLIRRGENSSFILTVWVKSVPLYHFKLACVALHIAVK